MQRIAREAETLGAVLLVVRVEHAAGDAAESEPELKARAFHNPSEFFDRHVVSQGHGERGMYRGARRSTTAVRAMPAEPAHATSAPWRSGPSFVCPARSATEFDGRASI